MASKRGNGEGTIRKLRSGRWSWVVMEGRNPDGTVHYVRRTADTRRELVQMIDQYRQDKRENKINSFIPFSKFSMEWYQRHQIGLAIATRSNYQYVLAKLIKYWENKNLTDIKTSGVHDMLTHFYLIGLSESYITKLRAMMHQIMEAAEADELIRKNPVRYVKFRIPDIYTEDEPKKDAFLPDEIHKIIAMPDSKIRDWVTIAIFSGLRLAEMLALRGCDILEEGRALRVTKAINMDRGKPVIGKTKNRFSVRTVPLPAGVQPIAAKYASCGKAYVWQSPKIANQPINPTTYRSQYKMFCDETGVRYLPPHCCRHTYVTLLRQRGVDAEIVKALVGHTRGSVTEQYNHIPYETLRLAAASSMTFWGIDSGEEAE